MVVQQRTLSPEQIGVATIPTDQLQANPHNPRMLFDKLPMATLRESIRKVGILVPLTVYKGKGQKKYTILDGQRRWMCAQELELRAVPVNLVAEPDVVQNIVTMFQIHKLREDWELMPTALKLEVLMERLQERGDRKLAELTGLDRAVVARCKKLLSFPVKYQELMLDPDPEKRLKADFAIELHAVLADRSLKAMDWFSRSQFIRRMLEKYQNPESDLKAVTDFRIMKQHINNARKAGKLRELSKRLKEYVQNDAVPMSHLEIKAASVSASVRALLRNIGKIEADLTSLDVQAYYGEEDLWRALEKLLQVIRSVLAAADRRPKE
jgi:ParB/RepB/Spo0J family partition protein